MSFKKAQDLLAGVLARYGINPQQAVLFDAWAREAGALGPHTEVLGLIGGVLRVAADSPACLQELRLSKQRLIRALNSYLGGDRIHDIRCVTQP